VFTKCKLTLFVTVQWENVCYCTVLADYHSRKQHFNVVLFKVAKLLIVNFFLSVIVTKKA